MGFKLKKVEIGKLTANEEKELCLELVPEKRAAIHGVVKFPGGMPAKNAVVKLFKKTGPNPCDLVPITFAFTDECGQFLFGVDSGIDFVIKVFFFKPERIVPCDGREKDDCDC